MADSITGVDSAQDDVMDVLSSPQKLQALLERAKQTVPTLADNPQFNAELLSSFNDWSRDVGQGSDPVEAFKSNVQTTLDKWQKGAAQQASKALETTATRFFSDPSSASQKDADVLLASPFRAEVVSVLNKSRTSQQPQQYAPAYFDLSKAGGAPVISKINRVSPQDVADFKKVHKAWEELPVNWFYPEPTIEDYLGNKPATPASAALASRTGLPNLQAAAAPENPPLPPQNQQAFGRTYADPNTGQPVSYMGPTGGVQTAEQAAAILSGRSPQSVLGNSKFTSTGTSAASALKNAESGLPDFGPVKSSKTSAKEKAALANKTAQEHPDWTRQQIIDFVNAQ